MVKLKQKEALSEEMISLAQGLGVGGEAVGAADLGVAGEDDLEGDDSGRSRVKSWAWSLWTAWRKAL